MWKVLIVDDETIVRTGLKMMSQWEELGFEVVAEANSGGHALQIMEHFTPHLIFTDIKMPGINGIELLRVLKEENPEIYVVILTNYDDKDYIKKALRLGANDFLMKSEVNATTLSDVLRRVEKQLFLKSDEIAQSKHISTENKRRFLDKLMNNAYENEQIPQKFKEHLGLDEIEKASSFSTALIYGGYKFLKPSSTESLNMSIDYLASLVSGIASKYSDSIVAYNEYCKIMYILLVNRENGMEKDELFTTCTDIKNAMELYADVRIRMGVSRVYRNEIEVSHLPGQGEEAYLYTTICEDSPIAFYEELNQELAEGGSSREFNHFHQLFLCDRDKLEDALEICREAITQIKQQKKVNLKRVFCNVFCTWFTRISSEDATNEHGRKDATPQRLINSYDCDELLQMVEELIFGLPVLESSYRRSNSAIDAILSYIHDHYPTPITLEDAAKKVHLNKNYLSTLFSEHTGISFVTYLTKYRVNQAKNLLIHTDMPVKDIAMKVGFSSDRYFGQVFKNETGHPPTHYRK